MSPQHECAVGPRVGLGENVGVAGNGVEARVDHHQLGAVLPGVGEFPHERRMADGRVGPEQEDQFGLFEFRKGVPETAHQVIAQVPAVEAGRIVGKIVG